MGENGSKSRTTFLHGPMCKHLFSWIMTMLVEYEIREEKHGQSKTNSLKKEEAAHHHHSSSASHSPTHHRGKNGYNGNGNHSVDDDGGSSLGGGPSPTPYAMSTTPSSASPSPIPMLTKSSSGSNANGLDLNMTASEMRAKLAARKKDKMDPKNQNIDLKKKYDIIQTL
ncbi:hypothetical protein Fcan01_28375 [Folsomia candida]|uniref:Uncharacterized protein n=1 Tax=Folsomia candida TaxID=158441 RepID=A0A226CXT0_FOLCA|nr:hypothetical protein Fcan01_28375 [Folsomia candida]